MIDFFLQQPKTVHNQFLVNKYKDMLETEYLTENFVIKFDNLTEFVKTNYKNLKTFKNSKIFIHFIFDVFIALYEQNNHIDEIKFACKFDKFIGNNKHIFYRFDEEMKILYLNIFIETY